MKPADGTSFLEEIPSQSPQLRLKYGVNRRTDKFETVPDGVPQITLDMIESWTGRVNKTDSEGDDASSGLVEFQPGDVLFSKLRPYLAKAFRAENRGAASPEFLVLRPTKFNARFLLYLLLSEEFIERVDASTYGAKMPRASWDFIGDLRVPCPDKSQQKLIADFLDYNTKTIDRTLERGQHLLENLREKRSSIVYHEIVQNDITPDAENRHLINQVPNDWDTLKLRWGTKKIGSGVTPKGGSKAYVDNGITFLRSQNIHFDGLHLEDVVYIGEKTNKEMESTQIEPGDVLLNITGASIGRCCVVPKSVLPANVNQHVCIIRPNKDYLQPEFLNYVISSQIVQHQIFSEQEGASREAITFEQIGDFSIPLPPLSKQNSIVNNLDESIEEIEKSVDLISKKIDLLKEKRQALITHAVTGQLDLSDWELPAEQQLSA